LNVATALELVKIHLSTHWLQLSVDDVEFGLPKGGNSSMIYTLEDKSGKVKEYSKVFIRVYAGGKAYDPENDTIGRQSESAQAVLAFKMGELGHGPHQLALFAGGRIEEFVPNRNSNTSDLENPEIVEQIARKVAIYHGMHELVPTTRKPRDVFITIRKHIANWSQQWLKKTLDEKLSEEQKIGIDFELLGRFDFETELQWIAEIRKHSKSPLVHAHYDLNSGNTLIRDKPDRHGHRVMLVDYEGACMEQRGFDLATHFNFHFTDSSKTGYLSGKGYPSLEYRCNFVEKYVDEWQKHHKLDPELDTVDHILWETDLNAPLHALFLLSWWIVPGDFALKDTTCLRTFTILGLEMVKNYFARKEAVMKRL